MENGKRFCVFCCRDLFPSDFPKESYEKYKMNNDQVKHFFKLFSRYCSSMLKKIHSKQYNACDNCIIGVNDFCNLYSQMDSLRVKLNWRLETLKTIMEQADKVPSRQDAFGPVEKLNGVQDDNEETRTLRNKFINDCSSHLQACWPKIQLPFHQSSNNRFTMTIPCNLQENQTNSETVPPIIEVTTQQEISNYTPVNYSETINIISTSSGEYNENIDAPKEVNLHNSMEHTCPSVENNQKVESSTELRSEYLIKKESLTSEISREGTQISSDFGDLTVQRQKEMTPHNSPDTITSPRLINDNDNDLDNNSMSTATLDDTTTLTEQCLIKEFNEDSNSLSNENEIGVSEICDDVQHDFGQQSSIVVVEKRRLRELFQCKICKLTFSTSERLNCHLKLHKDDTADSCSEGHQSPMSINNDSSSSESESDLDCKTNRKRYVQCSKCSKYFGKGNDIKSHMKTVHSSKNMKANLTTSGNKISSGTVSSISKATLLKSEPGLVTNSKSNSLLDTLLRLSFKCNFCQLTFSTAIRLEEHVKSHNALSDNSKSSVDDSESSYSDSSEISSESEAPTKVNSEIKKSKSKYSDNDRKPSGAQLKSAEKERIVPKTKFKCNICKITFTRKCTLQYHQSKHHVDNSKPGTSKQYRDKFKCPHCPLSYHEQSRKYVHIWKHHTNNPDTSPYIEEFVVMDAFTINDMISKENAQYSCKIANCEQTFLTEESLNDHSKLHDNFTCKFCSESFPFAPELAIHEANNHAIASKRKAYKCPRCPYEWHNQNKYVNHFLQSHFNLLMDVCRCLICKAPLYSKKKTLATHILGHHLSQHQISNAKSPEEIYKCGDCTAYFITPFQLSKHKLMFHSTGLKKHTCADCGRTFLITEQLRKHRKHMHKDVVGELKYACSVEGCERKFETKFDLDSHNLHRHTGRDPILMCNECGKRFGGKSALGKHMQVHDASFQEKRKKEKALGFVCEQCGKRFVKKEVLALHYKSHLGPDSWKFCCEICSKKCLTGAKLKEHMRVHTQEKPFVCEVCGQKYAHRHNWRLHLKSKHGQS